MDAQTCLQKMKLAGTLSLATVDEAGAPQIRCVSAVHYEPDAVYFLTSHGKEMTSQLLRDGRIQALVYTRFNEMIRMSGRAALASEAEQARWVDAIFSEQPYLANVYPGETRSICVIFKVEDIVLDYFNLGIRPIERAVFSLARASAPLKGCRLDAEKCIACGSCAAGCPQGCIVEGSTYQIRPEHCLHCGACVEACPVGAVERL